MKKLRGIEKTVSAKRIAILFEYTTLNGGENSILSMMEKNGDGSIECATAGSPSSAFEEARTTSEIDSSVSHSALKFVAIAPPTGRLTEKLKELGIPHIPFEFHDKTKTKHPKERLQKSLQQIVSDYNIDLLHANSLAMGRLTGSLASHLAIPCTSHMRDMMKLSQSAISDLNRNTKLIAVSKATREFHVAQELDPNRCAVIYNGIDPETFRLQSESSNLKKKLGVNDDAFLILNVGQICLRKAQNVLVNAFVEVAERIPNAHLVLAGERYSTKQESVDFEQSLVASIENAGLENRFHKLGFRDDIATVMCECDLLVHTAKQEPLGRVLLEAGAIGMPIIATDVGGTREILEHEHSGILLTPDDPSNLAAAMETLYKNPEKRKQLGSNARERIGEKFRLQDRREELFALWSDLM